MRRTRSRSSRARSRAASSCRVRTRRAGDSSSVTDDSGCCPGSPGAFLRSDVLSCRRQAPDRARAVRAKASRRGRDDPRVRRTRRLGAEAADILVDPMVSGIFAGDARQLSLRASFPKMWELEEAHGGLFRALLARRRKVQASGAPVGSPLGKLTSFRNGIETLPQRARRRRSGARFAHGTRVAWPVGRHRSRLDARARRRRLTSRRARRHCGRAGRRRTLIATLEPSLAATLVQIPSAPIAVIALGFDGRVARHPLDGFGFLVPRGQGLTHSGRALGVERLCRPRWRHGQLSFG